MKFLIFAGDTYYPGGGFEDFVKACSSREEAIEKANEVLKNSDWVHVVDLDTYCIVHISSSGHIIVHELYNE